MATRVGQVGRGAMATRAGRVGQGAMATRAGRVGQEKVIQDGLDLQDGRATLVGLVQQVKMLSDLMVGHLDKIMLPLTQIKH